MSEQDLWDWERSKYLKWILFHIGSVIETLLPKVISKRYVVHRHMLKSQIVPSLILDDSSQENYVKN